MDADVLESNLEIGIITRQWVWTAVYPGPDGMLWTNDDLTEESLITIPAGHRVWVTLRSEDVLHSLFIPAARFKKDTVPGRMIPDAIRPMEVGSYDAFCTEYCGQGHSDMTATLQVVSVSDYREHLNQLAQSE